jgi:hypothetical protein
LSRADLNQGFRRRPEEVEELDQEPHAAIADPDDGNAAAMIVDCSVRDAW